MSVVPSEGAAGGVRGRGGGSGQPCRPVSRGGSPASPDGRLTGGSPAGGARGRGRGAAASPRASRLPAAARPPPRRAGLRRAALPAGVQTARLGTAAARARFPRGPGGALRSRRGRPSRPVSPPRFSGALPTPELPHSPAGSRRVPFAVAGGHQPPLANRAPSRSGTC